ncbi:unnamed protein product [Effrenium voratum]|nr:unnamed protein product [Effrenium voratum]
MVVMERTRTLMDRTRTVVGPTKTSGPPRTIMDRAKSRQDDRAGVEDVMMAMKGRSMAGSKDGEAGSRWES